MSLIRIADNKQYLARSNGEPFFIQGVNYEGYFDRAWQMWDDNKFDPALISLDFQKMADAGQSVARLFVLKALDQDIRADNYTKLDKVLQLAADHNLLVLLTFNDSHYLNLAYAAQVDVKIARRYQDDPIILGWDLENEPVFYNFAAATYPQSHPAPLQSSALVDHYGQRVSQQEAIALQQQHRIPGHLSPVLAYYYINALKIFLEFNSDALAWASQHNNTLVDYMYHPDSANWQTLVNVLSGTVETWLAARHAPVRNADSNHLITVGYNWLHFAGLPANRALDFQEYHQYGSASLSKMVRITKSLDSLQRAFPDHPVMMGEYGYSNQTTSNPATSKPVDTEVTGLFESALLAYIRANNFAGGLKWMLNDVDTTANPYEASFGIYRIGDHAKPIKDLMALFKREWAAPPAAGTFQAVQDPVGLAFRFDLGSQTTLAGGVFQDETFSWQANGVGYCFINRRQDTIEFNTRNGGQLALDPWEVVSAWDSNRQSILYRQSGDTLAELAAFPPGERVSWDVSPGISYHLAMGSPVDPHPEPEPEIIPNPGEHVMLLGDSNQSLALSLNYIRKFAPDLTFAAEEVAGRWPYVTVVATETQVSNAILETISATGAQLVERISGDIAAILDDLVAKNRRFLASETDPPPTEPPTDPPPDPPPEMETYTVQPGDTLGKISLQFYGSSSKWPLIFEANRDILDDPGHIRPGMVLKIPPA